MGVVSDVSPEIIVIVTSLVVLGILLPIAYVQWKRLRRTNSNTIDSEVLRDYNCEFLDPLPVYDHPPDYYSDPPEYEHTTVQMPAAVHSLGGSTTTQIPPVAYNTVASITVPN